MDTEARQLGLKYLENFKAGESASRSLLEAARAASMEYGSTGMTFHAGRRAALAREAYTNRINATASRYMATYALLAAQEGDKAMSAQAVARRAAEGSRERVLALETVGHATRRRDLMLQASQAAASVLPNAPGLPIELTGAPVSASQQIPTGRSDTFRPEGFVSRTGVFFPSAIRAAAGSLKGLHGSGLHGFSDDRDSAAWMGSVLSHFGDGTANLEKAIQTATSQVTGQDPATAELAQTAEAQARGLLATLTARHDLEMVNGPPYLHIAATALATAALLYFLKK